jgi:integrase
MPPREKSLTDVAARTAKPREKAYKLAAGRGLYLEVMPNGARYWRFKFRYGGKEKRLALGVYPDISVKTATLKRDEAKKVLAEGLDPSAQRKLTKLRDAHTKENTFEAIATEWLGRNVGAKGEALADITIAKNKWLVETFALPFLGARPITEISAPEILMVLRRVESTGKHETAGRLRVKLSQIWRHAIQTGKAERDPAADLRGALRAPSVKHRAAITDPKRLGALLRAIDAYDGQPITAAALKIAPHVFVRPGELRGARWAEIDLKAAEWRIPAARMKMRQEHIVPLSTQVVAILEELHPLTKRSEFVFPSVRTWRRAMSDNTVNAALRRLGYTKDEVTGHGFRATASTRLNELGWAPDLIERQLAHGEKNKVRSAYNRALYVDDRRKMMQAWSDYLDGLRKGGDVVAIRKKGVK